jgi:translation initiation factor 1A
MSLACGEAGVVPYGMPSRAANVVSRPSHRLRRRLINPLKFPSERYLKQVLIVFLMSTKKEELERQQQEQEEISRIKLPRGKEVFGILEQRLGGSRMRIRCLDGKVRICRIPGRLKRRLWVREGDIVVVEPWEFSGDDKGDLVFKYTPTQVSYLRKKGLLKRLEDVDEF